MSSGDASAPTRFPAALTVLAQEQERVIASVGLERAENTLVLGEDLLRQLLFVLLQPHAPIREAVRDGYVEALADAGAIVTNSTCGACFGDHMGFLGAGEVCITASTRNFKGRMGSRDAEIYMSSPRTVAAAAIAGEIIDPKDVLG
jgi:aconitase B